MRAVLGLGIGLLLAGCVPMVTDMWTVQPVSGMVFDADNGAPVTGAVVRNLHQSELVAETGAVGEFSIEGQSHLAFHMAMPASYLDTQFWVISHAGYGDAAFTTSTLAPPRSEQPSLVEVPVFANAERDPDNCRFGHYRLRLVDYLTREGTLDWGAMQQLAPLDGLDCEDPELQRQWQAALEHAYRLPQADGED
ncbi:carboxypeptidase-like regulatory domain-containing protein [Marinobacter zhejiangensis]|uniref:Carboxypeptidase regulatory-like domain-containing protein n=1 Tax=Marinobacter zhejiangensis TaxID=488535 RepID=A0A1I4LJR4_9GAMM|nr:carboxypeptidase-like regulatory domain-containing protein [Marinobacter zhejiangensis]SFL91033.1 hypothetical protein SAMN04487963_0508 [Marinobacter zhejiangensis]